jgi:glycosyltransferase involved in cell wall biosynthesis
MEARRIGIDLTACWRPRVGMATVSLQLARAMLDQAADRRFTLFCSRTRPEGFESAPARAVLSPYRHEMANKLRWLPSVEAEAELDAMLYPYWPSPPRRRRGAPPAVVFVHDLAFRLRPEEVPWQQRLYMGSLVPPAIRKAAAVLVPSEATRRDLLDCYPLRGLADRLHVVPEASGLHHVEEASLPEGLEAGFILAVGTIEPRKNYPRLLAAHRLLRERREMPRLVVVGKVGWAFGRALDELRADPQVRQLGHVDDATLLALYRHARLLAFPSLYEGFGLPLLEAMHEGVPALIGNAGALPELANGAALAVDPTDVEAIAGGLERLLDDTELGRKLGEAGRGRAADYTWEAAARQTLAVLDGLPARSAQPA